MSTKPLFEHRHYVEIARIIASMPESVVGIVMRERVIDKFADELRSSNPLFDVARFRAAAMGAPSNGKDRPR